MRAGAWQEQVLLTTPPDSPSMGIKTFGANMVLDGVSAEAGRGAVRYAGRGVRTITDVHRIKLAARFGAT